MSGTNSQVADLISAGRVETVIHGHTDRVACGTQCKTAGRVKRRTGTGSEHETRLNRGDRHTTTHPNQTLGLGATTTMDFVTCAAHESESHMHCGTNNCVKNQRRQHKGRHATRNSRFTKWRDMRHGMVQGSTTGSTRQRVAVTVLLESVCECTESTPPVSRGA